jgi:hypothetical protein
MTTEAITWRPVSEPPDSDTTALLFDAHGSEPVWLGYKDENCWWYVDGHRGNPSHWADMPGGPKT